MELDLRQLTEIAHTPDGTRARRATSIAVEGPGAGTGRRRRLKSAGPRGRVGSTPTPGTTDEGITP